MERKLSAYLIEKFQFIGETHFTAANFLQFSLDGGQLGLSRVALVTGTLQLRNLLCELALFRPDARLEVVDLRLQILPQSIGLGPHSRKFGVGRLELLSDLRKSNHVDDYLPRPFEYSASSVQLVKYIFPEKT